jgi:hypothetical protein
MIITLKGDVASARYSYKIPIDHAVTFNDFYIKHELDHEWAVDFFVDIKWEGDKAAYDIFMRDRFHGRPDWRVWRGLVDKIAVHSRIANIIKDNFKLWS